MATAHGVIAQECTNKGRTLLFDLDMAKYICADCKHWEIGDTWGTNSRINSTVIACKGWCNAKPNKRKRWSYAPANNCQLFDKREQTSLIMSGCGLPTKEQLNTIVSFVEEKLGKQ